MRVGCPTKGAGTLRPVLFAVELLPGFQVDGTWNVPTTLRFQVDGTWNVPTTLRFRVDGTWNVPTPLTFVGCVPLGKEQAKLATAKMNENDVRPPLRRFDSPLIPI